MKLRNTRIGFRIGGLATLLLMLLTVVGGIGLLGLRSISSLSTGFIQQEYVASDSLGDLRKEMIQLRRHEKDILINLGNAESMQKYLKSWKDGKALVDDKLGRLDGMSGALGIADPLALLRQSLEVYAQVFAKTSAAALAGQYDTTLNANKAMADARAAFHDAEKAAKTVNETLERRASASATQIVDTSTSTTRWVAGAWLAGLALGAMTSWLIARSITRPIAEAVKVAQTVAAGDLTSRIEVRSTDETGQLLAALKAMNESLVGIVSRVRNSSDSIATGSAQIATGNADLSQRTEEQASNLQQTAASMEQLSGTVKSSAETASQASQLATSASAAAVKGGEMVGTVVNTMQDIAASSKRIADIIGVIDGIAFQTNILALNAAVEAARAGEQGRGFAVVASEVRSLAGRSAEAAKEIKSLIGASVERVELGARQVNDAGASMAEIVSQVQRVSQLISELSSASAEQSTGIRQVGEAVTQLDQVTQQNAALVEESAAAAESLKHQAVTLAEVVSVFKVTGGSVMA